MKGKVSGAESKVKGKAGSEKAMIGANTGGKVN